MDTGSVIIKVDAACNSCKRIQIYWMKNDPIMTVLIHHVTAKQAYQIRGIAESSSTATKALERQTVGSAKAHLEDMIEQ